ncbi:MAG: T9SS type A sorting domain-containing protein [Ignavibacteriaceae bacterium]
MEKSITKIGVIMLFAFLSTNLSAQSAGDYRSLANGDWSSAATWEVFDGAVWNPAVSAPTGVENITVDDTVTVDAVVSISGYVKVEGGGEVVDGAGSIAFEDGSTYEHAMDGGGLPTTTWNTGSTCLITGVTGSVPTNSNQDFYHFTWDCASQGSNEEVRWSGNTIGGNVTCVNSAGSQFRLTSSGQYTDSITIMGDVIVTGGTLASTGSSSPLEYLIIVHGDINVTGGTFGLSRGSGGAATWRLFGDLNVSNAELRTSNTSSKFVFAASDTQNIALQSVTYTSSWDYEILSSSTVRIVDGPDAFDLEVEQNFINGGDIIADGQVDFLSGANYQHTVNSGTVPVGTWETGSTATFTGIVSQAPANRNQSFYNIVWDCPGQLSNLNMGFDEVTIGGDITVVNTGASNRWYLCGPPGGDSATVTISGNIIQSGGQFSSNGSGNQAYIVITVNGDITVTGGNFAVSRGSQGATGSTVWLLNGTNFSMSDATTQNSNPDFAKFVFSGTTQQNLTLSNVTFSSGFPVEVATGAILDVGISEIEGSGEFILNDGATLQTANVAGIDSTLKNTGTISLSSSANYTYNGSSVQVTGSLLPATVNDLSVDNSSGVSLSGGVMVDGNLNVNNGSLDLNGNTVTLGPTATLNETAGNTVTGTTGMITTTRNLNAPAGDNVGGLGAMLTTASDLGSTTVERYHSAGSGGGNQGIFRTFNISPTNNSGLDATLRLYYDESELNGIPEANLILFKSADGVSSWVGMGGTVNTAENYVEQSGLSDFSYWTLGDVNNPIPVELTSFSVAADGKSVTLKWTTATETNNLGWDIERSENTDKLDGWIKLGFIDGAGNSTESNTYTFRDAELKSTTYFYRLKQIDFDGTSVYSETVEVEVGIPDQFALAQNYPNPFNPETVIEFQIPSNSMVNISVYNSIGEKVATLLNEQLEQGYYKRSFNGSNLPSGIYIYRLTANDEMFTRKMMLIK